MNQNFDYNNQAINQQVVPQVGVRQSQNSVSIIMKALFIVAVFVVGGIVFTLINSNQAQLNSTPDQTEQDSNKEVEDLVEQVGKLILIKGEEKPTVATVLDAEELKKNNPIFYADAKDGDKLLVYSDRAIIYRPESNMIINVTTIKRDDVNSKPQVAGEGTEKSPEK